MAKGNRKQGKYESVRIWTDQKERLEKLTARKILAGQRVTEVEQTSRAIDDYCAKEERKLQPV